MLHLRYHDIADRMGRSTAPGSAVGQLLIFLYRMRAEAGKHQHPAENERATQHLPNQPAVFRWVCDREPETVHADRETAPGHHCGPPEFVCEVVC
jgi:hypothetical protein